MATYSSGIWYYRPEKRGGSTAKSDIDWGGIYGRLCTQLGWCYRTVEEHTLGEVVELLEFLGDHPTSAEILTLVHGVKVSKRGFRKQEPEDEIEMQHTFTKEFGGLPAMGTAPEGFKEAFQWAEEQKRKLKIVN